MDINKTKYLPTTVMLNLHDPSLSTVSLAMHVTVVVPTGYKSPDHHNIAETVLTYTSVVDHYITIHQTFCIFSA